MSKCNKAKNPCKICLSPVTHKSGLQCQGACQSWVHYTCLNYTPGKIRDIKAGIIKVTCPCPDCKTSLPKEFRTDQPYSCNNSMCPANQPPKCNNYECPTNSKGGRLLPQMPPCPLSKCGTQCKDFSSDKGGAAGARQAACLPDPSEADSDACLGGVKRKCPSGCSSTNDVSGDYRNYQTPNSGTGSILGPNFAVVEKMCTTVGELTNQIKQLMCQMQQASNPGGGGCGGPAPPNPCPSPGNSTDICPKPCYCPGNPAKRM